MWLIADGIDEFLGFSTLTLPIAQGSLVCLLNPTAWRPPRSVIMPRAANVGRAFVLPFSRYETCLNFSGDFRANIPFGNLKVITGLQVQPELRRRAEIPGKPKRRIGCNGATFTNDTVDSRSGYFQFHRQCMGSHSQGNEEFLT